MSQKEPSWIARYPEATAAIAIPTIVLLILGAITQFDLAKKADIEKAEHETAARISVVEADMQVKLAAVEAAAKLRELAVRDLSFDHSDRNHEDMISRMKDVATDNRLLAQKLDSVLERLKSIEENTRKVRK